MSKQNSFSDSKMKRGMQHGCSLEKIFKPHVFMCVIWTYLRLVCGISKTCAKLKKIMKIPLLLKSNLDCHLYINKYTMHIIHLNFRVNRGFFVFILHFMKSQGKKYKLLPWSYRPTCFVHGPQFSVFISHQSLTLLTYCSIYISNCHDWCHLKNLITFFYVVLLLLSDLLICLHIV